MYICTYVFFPNPNLNMDIVGGFDNIYRKTKTLEDIFSKSETNTENYQVYA